MPLILPQWSSFTGVTSNFSLEVDTLPLNIYMTAHWDLLVYSPSEGFAVRSEVDLFVKGGTYKYVEHSMMGDLSIILYEIDFVGDQDSVNFIFTSRYSGLVDIQLAKSGLSS